MRQQLVALSDLEHSLTYTVLPGSPIAVENYVSTLRAQPVTDTASTFISWTATFDARSGEAERWRAFYAEDRFPAWLNGLRDYLGAL